MIASRVGLETSLVKSPPLRPRLIATLLLCLTFFFQTYLAQTHLHGAPAGTSIGAISLHQGAGHHPIPKDDRDDCPLCQAAGHLVAYFTVIDALLPTVAETASAPLLGPRYLTASRRTYHQPPRGPPHF